MFGFSRTGALISAIILGIFMPQAHVLSWGIRWLIMAMLFVVFLQTRLTRDALHRTHLVLLATNVAIGLAAWAAGGLFGGRDLALAAFFAGITPTAAAAPVIISFMRGRVDYVIAAFVLTNVVISAILPILLPVLLGQTTPEAFTSVLGSVGLVVFGPMLAGWLVRRLHPAAAQWPARLRTASFSMWIMTLFLITSNASQFMRTRVEAPLLVLLQIGAMSLAVAIVNFTVGHFIGGKQYAREASQSLGQKNTSFTIYLALTYASPLIALGPTSYVIWHNLWNSWQLHKAGRAAPKA